MNCSQLYVGAERALTEVNSEFITVERLVRSTKEYRQLSRVLQVAHVYYLASHAGCGCGWEHLGVDTEWDARNLASVKALEEYLRQEVKAGPLLLLSACSDSMGESPSAFEELGVAQLFASFNHWRVPFASDRVRVARLRVVHGN